MLTFGSLFSGIGGFDLGFERAGMICKWQVEIDGYCTRVLTRHWPTVPKFQDVRWCGKRNLEPVDVVCGGFPCQPFSSAGKRRGASDDRNLWPEMFRVVQELRPRWVVGENVPNIVNLYLDDILFDLESAGYEAWTVSIPACAFDAPHIRSRIFVIAYVRPTRARGVGDVSVKGGSIVPDPSIEGGWKISIRSGRQVQAAPDIDGGGWWTIEPDVGRVAHGVPHRVDRLRALGNAVTPQQAEWIARLIVEVDNA